MKNFIFCWGQMGDPVVKITAELYAVVVSPCILNIIGKINYRLKYGHIISSRSMPPHSRNDLRISKLGKVSFDKHRRRLWMIKLRRKRIDTEYYTKFAAVLQLFFDSFILCYIVKKSRRTRFIPFTFGKVNISQGCRLALNAENMRICCLLYTSRCV